MNKKIVLALGGNAIGNTHAEQIESAKRVASVVCDLVQQGYSVTITHGNGPQFGILNDLIQKLSINNPTFSEIPFSARVAMTQMYIGGDLKNALLNEFNSRGMDKEIVSIVTEVLVDKRDPAFEHPTKPIGRFMSKEQAEELSARTGLPVMEDAGRGYRTVVPSPLPIEILKLSEIKKHVDADNVLITCGGGGIPVIEATAGYKSVEAIIDKDFVSALLAQKINANYLLIATGIEKVTINYKKSNETPLGKISTTEAQSYINAGQFAEGSMKPKMQAAVDFADSQAGRVCIITSLDKVCDALLGNTGTKIVKGTTAKGKFNL